MWRVCLVMVACAAAACVDDHVELADLGGDAFDATNDLAGADLHVAVADLVGVDLTAADLLDASDGSAPADLANIDMVRVWLPADTGLVGGPLYGVAPCSTQVAYTIGDHVYRTANRGASWSRVAPIALHAGEQLNAITCTPTDSVVWVGTTNARLFSSTDSGATWTPTPMLGNAPNKAMVELAASPALTPQVFGRASDNTVYSLDASGTWSEPISATSTQAADLDVAFATAPELHYAVSSQLQIYNNSTGAFAAPSTSHTATATSSYVAPGNAKVLGTYYSSGPTSHVVSVITDLSTTYCEAPSTEPYNLPVRLALASSAVYVQTAKHILEHAAACYSTAGTATAWTEIFPVPNDTVSVTGFERSLDEGWLVASGGFGIASEDGISDPMKIKNRGINDLSIRALLDGPGTAGILAATDDGLFRSTTGGQTWDRITTDNTFGSIFRIVALAGTSGVLFASVEGDVYRSSDDGATWSPKAISGGKSVTAMALDPTNSATVYACDGVALWKSIDGGDTWNSTALLCTRVIADAALSSVYVASTSGPISRVPIDGAASSTVPGTVVSVNDLAVDASGVLFIAAGASGLLRVPATTTSGATPLSIVGVSSVDAVATDPTVAGLLIVGTDAGVFLSTDGGDNFAPLGDGSVPNRFVYVSHAPRIYFAQRTPVDLMRWPE